MKKRAVILAGGQGSRLRPYTIVLPKPLMPIGEYPVLEVIIKQLVKFGFEHITLAVNHQAELFKAFFADGKKWNVKIDYSLEEKPMGTIGPLKLIKNLPSDFLVMNGDILTDLNYLDFFEFHCRNKNLFTVSSFIRTHIIDYGVLRTNSDDLLINFQEKPVTDYKVSMGVYMVNRDIMNLISKGDDAYGFDNLMLDLLSNDYRISVKEHKGLWLDIGRPDDYMVAINNFEKMKNKYLHE